MFLWQRSNKCISRIIFLFTIQFQYNLLKFWVNFLAIQKKKHKLEKGGENLYEVLCKFYFRLDKMLNKICERLGRAASWVCFPHLGVPSTLAHQAGSAQLGLWSHSSVFPSWTYLIVALLVSILMPYGHEFAILSTSVY